MSARLKKPRITAKEEFEKNPDLKHEDLDELREWLRTQKHLPEVSEEMLILFHHSCYYQLTATKSCIDMFYTMRTNCPEFYTNRDFKHLELVNAITAMNLVLSPVTDSDGNLVMYYGLREFEPSKFDQSEHIKVICMMMDIDFLEAGTRSGLVGVFNMEGVRFGHLFRVNFSATKKFLQIIQEGSPVRIKKIHIINVVPFVDKFMKIIQPFMKKELFDLLHFHTGGMEEFYNEIPLKCLPKEIGGTLDSLDVINAENTDKLAAYADYFLEEEKQRIDESKRDKKKKNKLSETESKKIEFEKLVID